MPVRYLSRASLALACLTLCSSVLAQQKAEWVTLGTAGGPIIHAHDAQISNALVVGNAIYLFDVGNGVMRQLAAANLPLRDVRAVFLSHHHPDHNTDLGPVMLAKWARGQPEPMPVIGPRGTVHMVNGLVDANVATVDASYPVQGRGDPPLAQAFRAKDLPERMDTPQVVFEDDRIRVLSISVSHYDVPSVKPIAPGHEPLAVAYRIETKGDAKGRVIAYSGDTGPTPHLALIAKNADLLVTEVVDPDAIAATLKATLKGASADFVDGVANRMRISHLVPQEIGKTAAAAGVKAVVLTHYVPALEEQPNPENFTKGIAPTYKGPVLLSKDLSRF